MEELNKQGVTTLMVTHDPFSASFGKRIIFIKDGKVDSELIKGEKSRRVFYEELLAKLGTLEN
jgi:putative ABC transport system ATP-binding protein